MVDTQPTAPVAPVPTPGAEPRHPRPARGRRTLRPGVVLLTLVAAISAFPLYFMLVMASRRNEDITSVPPPRVLADPNVAFGKAVLNSLIVASVATAAVVVFSALAGFAFAKLEFAGRNPLLLVVIVTMMVPVQLGLIPLYMLMGWLHLSGQLPAVILPFLVSGFGVFMMRQFVQQAIPDEMLDSARLDGASPFKTFVFIVAPGLRPAAAVLALLTFMERWNDFLWPYLVLDQQHPVVQVALSRLSGGYYTDQALVMAGTLLGVLPLLVVFILFGRQIVGGIMEGGLKS
jgi:cellobiose transport system permease protein